MTVSTTPAFDPGIQRGLQRIVSPDGMINACALDVLDYLVQMLDARGRPSGHADVVAIKHDLLRALAPQASAVLLDAQYGLQAVAAGALPGTTGLMVTIEDEDYAVEPPLEGRRTVFREGWSVEQIKRAGADVAKLLWFYRPDRNEETAEHQRRILREVAVACREASIALVVEPIWYALPDEDPNDPAWRAGRAAGIVRSVLEADELGADLVKAEFPGSLETPEAEAAAIAACEEIAARITVPWVTLSGGVPFEVFARQVELSCRAGASGFLAGRAVWQDTVDAETPEQKAAALEIAAAKVAQLTAITAAHGRPFRPALSLDQAVAAMPPTWYLDWHAAG